MQKWIGFVVLGILFTGCVLPYLLGKREKDISNEPQYSYLFEETYEFVTDAFLVKNCSQNYTWIHKTYKIIGEIGFPRTGSDLPYTMEDYERDPENWHYTDTWAGERHIAPTGRATIIGIINRGTRFKIYMVTDVQYPSGNEYQYIYLQLLDGEFADQIVEGHLDCFYADKLQAQYFKKCVD